MFAAPAAPNRSFGTAASAAPPRALLAAVLAATALHVLAWQALRSVYAHVRTSAAPPLAAVWRVQLRPAQPAAAPPRPTAPKAEPPKTTRPKPVTKPKPAAPQKPKPRPAPKPQETAAPPAAPAAPSALRGEERAGSAPPSYLDATQADTAPAPLDGEWQLDTTAPWPPGITSVHVRIWIARSGRIERFEVLGAARHNPAIARIFSRLAQTPMIAAHIGRVPVPSVVRVQFLATTQGAQPDFVLPIPDNDGESVR